MASLSGTPEILVLWFSPTRRYCRLTVRFEPHSQDAWHDQHNQHKILPGDATTAVVSPLRPATAYHFRLYAENHLGASAPSDVLHAQTDGEVPGGPPLAVTVEPLGARQLLVTWRPPERDMWNGDLLGFTIGYQRIETDGGRTIGTGTGNCSRLYNVLIYL